MMYQFTYSAICEDKPARALSRGRLVSDAIELFEAANSNNAAPHERLQLLSEFRRVWLAIASDFYCTAADPAGMGQSWFPMAADGVLEEIERRRFKTLTRREVDWKTQLEPLL